MKVYNYSSLSRRSKPVARRRRSVAKTPKKRTHLGSFNNPFKVDFSSINSFYFQIAGIFMITLGIVISFQTLIDFSTPGTEATDRRDSVRVITNFQTQTKQSAAPKVNILPPEVQETEEAEEEVKAENVEEKELPATNENLPVYVVKPGDTLQSIADLFGLRIEDFVEVNPSLEAPYALRAEQQLYVPAN